MSFSTFGAYEILEAGDQSQAIQRLADARALSATLHYAKQTFGSYLNNSQDERDFGDRLSYIRPDLAELVAKTSSIGHLNTVIAKLKESWNFDKKKDDDSGSGGDGEKSKDDNSSDDSDDDSSDDDSSDDSDSDTPDYVDTDKDDDDKRDDSKESKRASLFAKANERFAAPQHLDNSFNPNSQWHTTPMNYGYPGEGLLQHTNDNVGGGAKGEVYPNKTFIGQPGFGGDVYNEWNGGAARNPTNVIPFSPTSDGARAEVEKNMPQVGAPGRHRASYPVVARNAKPITPRTAADLPKVPRKKA